MVLDSKKYMLGNIFHSLVNTTNFTINPRRPWSLYFSWGLGNFFDAPPLRVRWGGGRCPGL